MHKNNTTELGELIKNKREELDISQRDLLMKLIWIVLKFLELKLEKEKN